MGSMMFTAIASGHSAQSAFDKAVAQALIEHGNQGYSGTIAEKDSFVEFPLPETFVGQLDDYSHIDEDHNLIYLLSQASPYQEIFDDKWGPAVCVLLSTSKMITTEQVGISANETELSTPRDVNLAYRITSDRQGKLSISESTHLPTAIQHAKRLAEDGSEVKVTAFYQIQGGDPVVFEAKPIFGEVEKAEGLKTYLFTGYASC